MLLFLFLLLNKCQVIASVNTNTEYSKEDFLQIFLKASFGSE